ncbi:two-component system response regulator QseB [Sulfuriferula multivorans]|uniref:Two-component system response regulator QseB n=1 Tax=Sulfuriferula multivorans TaxID=1559896 RepID=A0A401JHE2_9PROT|nr:response regulator transcription factor [Sulfuriferula multivorans]GBL47417.1 two-component system response regulator QseB [Sulfuriferula multivorans]
MQILLIEDDPMIGQSLVRALKDVGISSDWVRDGVAGESAIESGKYSLVLLDLGLPKKSGFDVLKTMRAKGDHTPLLIITARDEIDDRVTGLDLGADDYLIKPFGLKELMARIRAILRRNDDLAMSILGNGEITLNLATHETTYRGKTLSLSSREFTLLQALVDKPGTILSRTQLEDRLYPLSEEIGSNAVDVLIHYLRKKFDNEIIRNVRGVGWMVVKHPS